MIKLGKVVQIENSFLQLVDATDDEFTFEMMLTVDDDQLVNYGLASLNVSVYSKVLRSPMFKTLSDAIKNHQADAAKISNDDLIEQFSIDLSTGYESNISARTKQALAFTGNFSSNNKSLLGIKSNENFVNQNSDTDIAINFTYKTLSTRRLSYTFKILRSQLLGTSLYFEFSLQSLKKKGTTYNGRLVANVVSLIAKFIKISSVPSVDLFTQNKSIYVKINASNDPSVKSVRIFKRSKNSSFSKLSDVNLDSSYAFLILDQEQDVSEIIYRFVNLNESNEESDSFIDKVIKTRNIESPVIYGEPMIGGYKLFATSIPDDALYGRFKYKEASNRLAEQQTTGEFTQIIDNTCSATIKDYLRPNGLYEVTFEYVTLSGVTLNVGNFTFRNIPKSNDGITVDISELNVDSSNLDVSFKINYSTQPSDNDLVKNLLTAIDSAGLYQEEIKKVRSQLSPLVAFQVYRLDLTTGAFDDLGIIEGNKTFSDSTQRRITGASQLDTLHTYRYQIKTLIRYPETVLTNLTEIVKGANKDYTLQPSKFLHPKSLESGTLFSDVGLKTLFSQSEFEFGESGNVTIIRVSFDQVPYTTSGNSISQYGSNEFLVNFNISGMIDDIDYYNVLIQKSNGLMPLGKKFSSKKSVSFVIFVDDLDLNFSKIIIEPVFVNSKKGIPLEFINTFDTINLIGKITSVVSNSGI